MPTYHASPDGNALRQPYLPLLHCIQYIVDYHVTLINPSSFSDSQLGARPSRALVAGAMYDVLPCLHSASVLKSRRRLSPACALEPRLTSCHQTQLPSQPNQPRLLQINVRCHTPVHSPSHDNCQLVWQSDKMPVAQFVTECLELTPMAAIRKSHPISPM